MSAFDPADILERLRRLRSAVVYWRLTLKFLATIVFCLPATTLLAQDTNPLGKDAEAAKLGEFQFRSNCAFCHGLGARGGGRGPDLTRAHKTHGQTDADLFHTINEGISGTAMPPNGTTGQGV